MPVVVNVKMLIFSHGYVIFDITVQGRNLMLFIDD